MRLCLLLKFLVTLTFIFGKMILRGNLHCLLTEPHSLSLGILGTLKVIARNWTCYLWSVHWREEKQAPLYSCAYPVPLLHLDIFRGMRSGIGRPGPGALLIRGALPQEAAYGCWWILSRAFLCDQQGLSLHFVDERALQDFCVVFLSSAFFSCPTVVFTYFTNLCLKWKCIYFLLSNFSDSKKKKKKWSI